MAFAPTIAFDYLRRAHASDRLGHAYLLVGDETGGFQLARQLAALVAGTDLESVLKHPDVYVVEPESKARRILIEQMRELEGALRLRATVPGGRKVGILRQADRINNQAANAFLKTLEEPPAQSLLLLVTSLPESLPETILSRCIKVTLQQPDGGGRELLAEESAVEELLDGYARSGVGEGSVPVAYGLLRDFSEQLASVRGRLQSEADAALQVEEDHYAKTTDGTWLGEREAYYKSLVDARYVAARANLVERVARWWGNVLRAKATGETAAAEVRALANRRSTADLLRRLAVIESLRQNLDRNIQEALALEVAFLEIFGT